MTQVQQGRQHEPLAKIDTFLKYCLFCYFLSWHARRDVRSKQLTCERKLDLNWKEMTHALSFIFYSELGLA